MFIYKPYVQYKIVKLGISKELSYKPSMFNCKPYVQVQTRYSTTNPMFNYKPYVQLTTNPNPMFIYKPYVQYIVKLVCSERIPCAFVRLFPARLYVLLCICYAFSLGRPQVFRA